MTEAKIFTDGMLVKAPREGAPDFVKGSLSFRSQEFIHWLENNTNSDGWCNVDLLEGRSGKWYGAKNNYSKEAAPTRAITSEDSPF